MIFSKFKKTIFNFRLNVMLYVYSVRAISCRLWIRLLPIDHLMRLIRYRSISLKHANVRACLPRSNSVIFLRPTTDRAHIIAVFTRKTRRGQPALLPRRQLLNENDNIIIIARIYGRREVRVYTTAC